MAFERLQSTLHILWIGTGVTIVITGLCSQYSLPPNSGEWPKTTSIDLPLWYRQLVWLNATTTCYYGAYLTYIGVVYAIYRRYGERFGKSAAVIPYGGGTFRLCLLLLHIILVAAVFGLLSTEAITLATALGCGKAYLLAESDTSRRDHDGTSSYLVVNRKSTPLPIDSLLDCVNSQHRAMLLTLIIIGDDAWMQSCQKPHHYNCGRHELVGTLDTQIRLTWAYSVILMVGVANLAFAVWPGGKYRLSNDTAANKIDV